MNQLAAILPELILTVGAIVLMMVAAFGGRAVAASPPGPRSLLLVAATVALIGAPQNAGPLFGGLIVADGFGAFGKLIIFLVRRGGDHRRARLVRARLRAWRRISGADPVQRGRHGGDGLGDQPDDALRRPRAAEPRRPTSSPPTAAPTSARPRRASNISSSARSPAASCSTAFRCSTASPARWASTGIAAAFARDGDAVDRPAVRPGLPARRPRLQDQRRAVPHVDARRLRRRADAGHRLLRLGAQGRRGAARHPRLPRCARRRRSTPGGRS